MNSKNNGRRYLRVKTDNPICAEMTITYVGDRVVNTGKKSVCIQDISIGGLCFWSDLNFPVNPDVVLNFHINIFDNDINLSGCIARKLLIAKSTFEYGIHFIDVDEAYRIYLMKIRNNILMQMKNKVFVSNCSTCKLRDNYILKSINKVINTLNSSAYKEF